MKIEMSNVNIKGILAKLSVLKSNWLLSASIGIALVAVLLFIPVKLVSGNLKKAVGQRSLRLGTQVKSARRSTVSKDQWKELAKYEAVYENDANQIARLAIQSTQRQLLSYSIFPEPKDQSSAIFKMFGDNYRLGIDALLKGVNASDCPTDEELDQGMANASATSPGGGAARQYSTPSSRPRPLSGAYSIYAGARRDSPGQPKSVESTIRDEICLSRAKAISVYADPPDLAGYEFWGEYRYDVKPEDAVQDCWYYQLGYWVIEDVFSTIGSMNSGSPDVLTAPVKRLLEVGFKSGGNVGSSRASSLRRVRKLAVNPRSARPGYVGADLSGSMANSFTGRFSDNDIDVIHFKFSAVIAVKSVLPFMKELCSGKQHKFKGFFDELPQTQTFVHNQITVLQSKFIAVDRLDSFHSLYRYGQDAVVELRLVCEYVFNKSAYDDIKPAEVKAGPEPPPGRRTPPR